MPRNRSDEPIEVGVRELSCKLSHYINQVQHGHEVVVTIHGNPVAKLTSVGGGSLSIDELVAHGRIRSPRKSKHCTRHKRFVTCARVSDIVNTHRR